MNFFRPDKCQIKIAFSTEYYTEYETKNIINDLTKREYRSLKFLQKVNTNESIEYVFNSNTIGDPEFDKRSFECSLDSLNWKYSRLNHNNKSSFKVEIQVLNEKYTFHKFLAKTQWRKFIDEMKSPVFLDNVTDLHSDYFFWVQKQKIVKKEKFIKKYLSYTKHSS